MELGLSLGITSPQVLEPGEGGSDPVVPANVLKHDTGGTDYLKHDTGSDDYLVWE